jgi:hypothetical protein
MVRGGKQGVEEAAGAADDFGCEIVRRRVVGTGRTALPDVELEETVVVRHFPAVARLLHLLQSASYIGLVAVGP